MNGKKAGEEVGESTDEPERRSALGESLLPQHEQTVEEESSASRTAAGASSSMTYLMVSQKVSAIAKVNGGLNGSGGYRHDQNGDLGHDNRIDAGGGDDSALLEDDLTSALLPPSPGVGRRPLIHPDNRRAARQVIRRMGDYLAYFTLLAMLVIIPIMLYRALSIRKLDKAAFNSAGVMACGTVILSLRLVYLHLTHWYMPDVQKYVVRILWMVPLYSVQSWLSLLFHDARIYIDTIRDLYEAYVIASFVYYLIELLGGQDALVQILVSKRSDNNTLGHHPFPFKLILQPWELGIEFLLQCKHGVLQYVVFKIIASIATYVCESFHVYGEGQFSWKVAYPYLAFFQNISVMYALYSLVMLYSAVKEELQHPVDWRPLGKFLCIKGVVFFTWWQGVIIFYLRAHGIIGDLGNWSSEDVAYGLIDYCIVVEMVGFAIAHSYTYTYKEYLPGHLPSVVSMHEQPHDRMVENGDDENDLDQSQTSRGRACNYRPPATLDRPMGFRDALWSSTLPKETFQDIQKLRTGIDFAVEEALRPRGLSLQQMNTNTSIVGENANMVENNEENTEDPPETTFV